MVSFQFHRGISILRPQYENAESVSRGEVGKDIL